MSAKLPAMVPVGQLVALPAAFGEVSDADFNLADGIVSGFGVISIRGKVWRVRYKGEETIVRDATGEPVRRLQAIVLGSGPNVSKTYYAGEYVSGSNENPDCASTDGIRPDAGVSDPQCDLCATCPKNVIGSKITNQGKKIKACQDNKRLAIVPAKDVANEAFGGPMLLRIPPTSFQSLDQVSQQLREARWPFFAAVLDMSFDAEAEYPMIAFKFVGKVTDETMAATIMKYRESSVTESILFGTSSVSSAPPPAAPAPKPAAAAPKPAATTRRVAAAPKPAAPPVEEPPLEDLADAADAGELPEPEAVPDAPPPAAKAATKAAAPARAASPSAEDILGDLLAGL